MGNKELKKRKKWQDESGQNATTAESIFFNTFRPHLASTDLVIRKSPTEFREIYVNYPLDDSVIAEIYTPDEPIVKHGITPDFAIDNSKTRKTLYIEVKKQDGWVEGKTRAHGRGNAHERCCKYFTPGLLKILRDKGNIHDELPFWTVFVGDITRDPCRVREITCWFNKYPAHFFFWRDISNTQRVLAHFDQNLKNLLD